MFNTIFQIKRESSEINRRVQVDMKAKAQLLEELGKLKAEHDVVIF